MVLQRSLWAATLAVQCTSAFKNTSPFFYFSTSSLTESISEQSHSGLVSAKSIHSQLDAALASCPSDTYIIINQPDVAASDFTPKLSSPNLRQYLNRTAGVVDSWSVAEVVGSVDAKALEVGLVERCKADVLRVDATTGAIPNDGVFPRIVYVQFPPLSNKLSERSAKLAEHDSFLHAVISEVGGSKYSVLYTTTPPSSQIVNPQQLEEYEMDDPFASVLHTDLKRDIASRAAPRNGSDLPLFDTYQFTSPGIFMGISVFLLMLSILYVGLNAVSSLQVSYFAFSKEMGPSGQKKSG